MNNINLLYIDLFCGAGGTSTGVESATVNDVQCAKVIACVNHDANAIASHAANHPDALHFTEDIRTLELSPLVSYTNKMKTMHPDASTVLWASLECTNFSKAKGGQARDADSRTLAEHLFRYIEALNPDYIQIENVEEFMSWGDMTDAGKPISSDKGKSYLRWVKNVKKYGYKFQHRILNAADFGAYTSRKRFFGVFAKTGLPIVWPEPTHSREAQCDLFKNTRKWKPVKDVLDFSDEGESIFTRKKPLSDKTLERIYAGLIKFVAGGKESFLTRYNSGQPQYRNKSIEEPCGVLTTSNRFAKVQCKFLAAYYGNGINCSSVASPCPTVPTKDRFNYVSPKFIDQQFGNSKPASVDKPLGALTQNPKYNIVSPWIMNTNFSNVGSSINDPAQTVTANRKWHYLMNPQFRSSGGNVNNPCFTLIARMDKMPPYFMSVIEGDQYTIKAFSWVDNALNCGPVFIYKNIEIACPILDKIINFMMLYNIIDIKMRMLRIPELKKIMGFPEDYVLLGTQADQKKFIGNAVEVTMARSLCKELSIRLRGYKSIAIYIKQKAVS